MPPMKPLPTLRQLRYLVAVVDRCHFGQAAEACLVSQSTLSAGIQELEALLGVPLLWRATVKACHAALDLPPPDAAAETATTTMPPAARILVAAREGLPIVPGQERIRIDIFVRDNVP